MNATALPASVALSPRDSATDATHRCGHTRARRLTVGSLPAPWPAFTPFPGLLPYLRLRGRWLEAAGFAVGAKIRVRVESRRLILEVIDPQCTDTPAPPLGVHEPDRLRFDMGTHIL